MAIRNPPLPKHPTDYAEYQVPWEPWLCDGHTLRALVEVTPSDASLTVANQRLLNTTTVAYTLSGGTAPTDVDVTVVVETTRLLDGGYERLARIFPVQVRD